MIEIFIKRMKLILLSVLKVRITSCIVNAVGVRKARKLAGGHRLPIIGVHHMEAHALVPRWAIVTI